LLRFARSLIKFLREAPKSLSLRALDRSPLFLCDKNTFLLDCLIDRGELTRVACAAENLHSPERSSLMTVTATRPDGHSFRRVVSRRDTAEDRAIERLLKIRKKLGVKGINMLDMPSRPKPKSMRRRRHARLRWVMRCVDHRQAMR
jgi:hypothetical protein